MNSRNDALASLSTEELRAAVRAVLREVLPAGTVPESQPARTESPPSGEVSLHSEADLTAFVRRIASLCDDPQRRAALRDGHHGFRLRHPPGQADREPSSGGRAAVMRVERGAVTERSVMKAAAEGARLVIGRGAVVTPLARDKARVLGVDIEKER